MFTPKYALSSLAHWNRESRTRAAERKSGTCGSVNLWAGRRSIRRNYRACQSSLVTYNRSDVYRLAGIDANAVNANTPRATGKMAKGLLTNSLAGCVGSASIRSLVFVRAIATF